MILPGDIRELLNKVTEARKAAEAAVITRREETAAMRSQLNSANWLKETRAYEAQRARACGEGRREERPDTLPRGAGLSEQLTKLI